MSEASRRHAPPHHVYVIANEKGGVGKTTCAAYLVHAVKACGGKVALFEVDEQARLGVLTGEAVTSIRLPDSDAVATNDLAVIDALAPAFTAMLSAGQTRVLVDVGANHDAALLAAANAVELDDELRSSNIRIAVILPTTAEADSVTAALKTARRTSIALPTADIIIANMFFERRGVTPKSLALLNADYGTLIGMAHSSLDFPALRPRALTAFETSRMTLDGFADMSPRALATAMNDDFFTAKSITHQFSLHLATVSEEMERCFRFQSSRANIETEYSESGLAK